VEGTVGLLLTSSSSTGRAEEGTLDRGTKEEEGIRVEEGIKLVGRGRKCLNGGKEGRVDEVARVQQSKQCSPNHLESDSRARNVFFVVRRRSIESDFALLFSSSSSQLLSFFP
jgi:hypothetical protein